MKKYLYILTAFFIFFAQPVFSKGIESTESIINDEQVFDVIELSPERNDVLSYNNEESHYDKEINLIKSTVVTNRREKNKEGSLFSRSWNFIKGKPADTSVLLGMFSYHTMEGRENLNETNNLAGVDCKGYTFGTFNNSYHVQTYYAGLSRKVKKIELFGGIDMDLKYKVVALYGYKDYEPDVLGITPNIIPMMGFTKGLVGIDFLVSPGRTLTFATNFRVNVGKK